MGCVHPHGHQPLRERRAASSSESRIESNDPTATQETQLDPNIDAKKHYASCQVHMISKTDLKFLTGENGKQIVLGKGGYAKVYSATWVGTSVAVKILNNELPQDVRKAFELEVSALATLRHPHIVQIIALCENPPFLVMPLMKQGSLHTFICQGKEIPLKLKLRYLIHAVKGMAFVHECNILHGDIKPDNILVDENDVAYLADFGLSKVKTQATMSFNRANNATAYSSPEIMVGQLTQQGDMYSFGVTAWAFITYKTPYLNEAIHIEILKQRVQSGLRPDETLYPSSTPPALKSLLAECWHEDTTQRPSFMSIIPRLELIAFAL